MDVGAELRQARLQAGLSREDVAQQTKIQLAKIEALEANAFERLPEGLYLDGLIRAFAAAVGLDGAAMVARLRRHDAIPEEDAVPTAALPLAADPHRGRESLGWESSPAGDVQIVPAPVPAAQVAPSFGAFASAEDRSSRGRWLAALTAIVAALALGAYLYDVRDDRARVARAAPVATEAVPPSGAADDRDASEAPSKTPPMWPLPGERPSTPEVPAKRKTAPPPAAIAPPGPSQASPARPAPSSPTSTPPSSAPTQTSPAPTGSAPDTQPARGRAEDPRPGMADSSSALGSRDDSIAPPDLTGTWTLDTRVESASLNGFHGLQLEYQLELQQEGARVTGRGVKAVENGQRIAPGSQTPIALEGTVDGSRVTLTFIEHGARRESEGKMILDVYKDGVLRGRFSSTAARSSGTAEARRPRG